MDLTSRSVRAADRLAERGPGRRAPGRGARPGGRARRRRPEPTSERLRRGFPLRTEHAGRRVCDGQACSPRRPATLGLPAAGWPAGRLRRGRRRLRRPAGRRGRPRRRRGPRRGAPARPWTPPPASPARRTWPCCGPAARAGRVDDLRRSSSAGAPPDGRASRRGRRRSARCRRARRRPGFAAFLSPSSGEAAAWTWTAAATVSLAVTSDSSRGRARPTSLDDLERQASLDAGGDVVASDGSARYAQASAGRAARPRRAWPTPSEARAAIRHPAADDVAACSASVRQGPGGRSRPLHGRLRARPLEERAAGAGARPSVGHRARTAPAAPTGSARRAAERAADAPPHAAPADADRRSTAPTWSGRWSTLVSPTGQLAVLGRLPRRPRCPAGLVQPRTLDTEWLTVVRRRPRSPWPGWRATSWPPARPPRPGHAFTAWSNRAGRSVADRRRRPAPSARRGVRARRSGSWPQSPDGDGGRRRPAGPLHRDRPRRRARHLGRLRLRRAGCPAAAGHPARRPARLWTQPLDAARCPWRSSPRPGSSPSARMARPADLADARAVLPTALLPAPGSDAGAGSIPST